MKTFIIALITIFFTAQSFIVLSQPADALDKLPEDPDVITGTLENGLKYYIRNNTKPEQRVEFRLVLKAGSILEDDDQQGLAHFLEHMAFNGTEDFTKNDLVNFLEKSGLDFGADLNAYTSFDETVYMFQMPSDRQGLLDSAFMVLENWAHKLSLDETEIDKERGVVHEEWRLRLGAQNRMMKQYIPILFKDSRYADRLPIGKMSVIDSCEYEAVSRFYNDWYRPDLMAIVVVGDIEPSYAEEMIKSHFSLMTNPENERERTVFDIPENGLPLVAIATDKEATSTSALLVRKLDKFTVENIDDYRTKLKLDLFIGMMNARFFEETQNPESPSLYSGADYGGFVAQSLDAFMMYSVVKENGINDAITMMFQENKRVKRYGFTASELERQKAQMTSNIEKALEEKDKTESRTYVNEYVNNFLEKEPFPGIDYEAGLIDRFLPGITLDEVNQMAYYVGKEDNLIVLITAPEKEEVVIPSEDEVLATIKTASQTNPTEYKEEEMQTSLITTSLAGGTIVNTTEDLEMGIHHLELSNGVKVILKPTDFKNDEILMNAYGLGGTSLATDEEFISANFASQILGMSGVGTFDNVNLSKFMTGKNVSVSPEIGELTQGLGGKSVKKDLEIMFQLSYLHFTQPRKDTTAFKTFLAQMETQFKYMKANPQVAFYDTLYKLATQNDPRTIVIPTEAQINSINLDEAYMFYKNRYANANGFTFVFVGSFEMENIKPLITKYLGSLPSTGAPEKWKNVSPEFPSGITEAVVNKGTEPKSSVAIMMDGEFNWEVEERLKMDMLLKILNIRMRESMREDQGGVYGVRARVNTSKYPNEEVNLMIGWGCAPENVDQLVSTVFAEMDTLKIDGPESMNISKAKETIIRDYESNFEKNNYWLGKIKNASYYEEGLAGFDQLKQIVEEVSAADLQKLAKRYFTETEYLKVILMPEETDSN